MIKSVRIHNTSDGGQLDIGASDRTIIEVNGHRFPLASLVWLRELAESGTMVKLESVGPMISFTPHKCPEQKPVSEPASKPARKKASDE